jgi:dihydroxyacetone kinase-like protein
MNRRQTLTKADLVSIIGGIGDCMEANKAHLSKLDTEIGDGDHGFSMSQGFSSLCAKMDDLAAGDIGNLLKKCGLEMIKVIGGAAGAIFGTFFTAQASYDNARLKGKEALEPADITGMLAEALAQIKKRGGAQPGDKTMVDALEPAVDELKRGLAKGLPLNEMFQNASLKAAQGAEKTKSMVARHGRAKYLAERSLGFVDPGAVSLSLIFKTIADALNGK